MSHEKKKEGSEKSEKSKTSSSKKDTKNTETMEIGDFLISEKDCIGEGGFGVVYRGYNSKTGEFVAIKKIPLKNKKKEDVTVIKNEISLMAGLNDPHIVRYIDNKEKGGFLYIVMEYLETGSLQSLVKRYKLSEEMIARYIQGVLEGLKYLHGEGIIHRDIKGDNVLLTKKSEVKLADFGVAQTLDNLEENDIAGTPYWMAPEIISLAGAQYTSDIWSVGCMVLELVTGKPPYYDLPKMSAMYKIVMDEHPPIPGGLSSSCMDFLMFCFKKDPGLRKDATELLKHPWVSKLDIPKLLSPKKIETPVVVKPTDPKKLVEAKKVLSKFQDDDDEPIVPLKKAGTTQAPSKIALSISKKISEKQDSWGSEGNDDEDFGTIVKGSDIVKKLQEMKITKDTPKDTKDDDWKKVPESPLNVLQGKSKVIQKWSEEDDDKPVKMSAKKSPTNLALKVASKQDIQTGEDDDLESLFDMEAQNTTDYQDKHQEEAFMRVIATLVPESQQSILKENIEKLLEYAQDSKMQKIFNEFMGNTCLIPIIDILAATQENQIQLSILKLLRIISKDNKPTQENLALIGAFPKIVKFSGMEFSKEVRQEANWFIYYLCMESKNIHGVQMFIASAGLPVLIKFLKHKQIDIQKDEMTREMIIRTIEIVLHIINLTVGKNHKRDFCRLFSESDILVELCNILKNMASFKGYNIAQPIFTICNIFSTYGDRGVKSRMCTKEIMTCLYSAIPKVNVDLKVMLFSTIRNVSYEISEALVETGALTVLVHELKWCLNQNDILQSQSKTQKVYYPVINSLFALCVGPVGLGRDSENEQVARDGIIVLLYDTISKKLAPLDIPIRLLNKVALATNATSLQFLKDGGVQFFFGMLKNQSLISSHASVMDRIYLLLSKYPDETQKVLVQKDNIKIIVDTFKDRNIELLAPFFNIINKSSKAASLFCVDDVLLLVFAKWLNTFKDPKDLKKIIEVLDKLFASCENKTGSSKFIAKFKDQLIVKSKSPNKQIVRSIAQALLDKFK